MLDAFSNLVINSNNKAKKINQNDLQALKVFINNGNKRLDTVNAILSNASCMVSDAVSGMICEQPQLITPGGSCHNSHSMAACLRDGEIILRYISYTLLVSDSSILDDRRFSGLRDTYMALGISTNSSLRVASIMKAQIIAVINSYSQPVRQKNSLVNEQSILISEVNTYFDKLLIAIS
jgi:phycoerythrin beta chain